jgi:predicted amidohydrolase
MAGVYHNSAYIIDTDGSAGLYRKMHIPDDPHFMKNSILHLAIWVSKPFLHEKENWNTYLLGSMVS